RRRVWRARPPVHGSCQDAGDKDRTVLSRGPSWVDPGDVVRTARWCGVGRVTAGRHLDAACPPRAARPSLRAAVRILVAHDVVLAEVAARLHLDDLERHLAGV